jgi:hypothetical protein
MTQTEYLKAVRRTTQQEVDARTRERDAQRGLYVPRHTAGTGGR